MKNTLINSLEIKKILAVIVIIAGIFVLSACAEGEPDVDSAANHGPYGVIDPYDDNQQNRPVLTSIEPADYALAGVQSVTLRGEGFSHDAGPGVVTYFGGSVGKINSYTDTEINVLTPDYTIDDDVDLQEVIVSVSTYAAAFSDSLIYHFRAPVKKISDKSNQKYWAIAIDANDNVYLQGTSPGGGSSEIIMIEPGAVPAILVNGSSSIYRKLLVGEQNKIFGVRRQRAIFYIDESSSGNVYKKIDDGSFSAMDFDKDLTLYVGSDDGLNRIWGVLRESELVGGTAIENILEESVVCLRVFNDRLYAGVDTDSLYRVISAPIIAPGTLGTFEEYYDFSTDFGDTVAFADINFTTDGTLFLGLTHRARDAEYPKEYKTAPFPIAILTPDKKFEQFYPTIETNPKYQPNVAAMHWNTTEDLYYVREYNKAGENTDVVKEWDIVKVVTGKQTAPYYGRDL